MHLDIDSHPDDFFLCLARDPALVTRPLPDALQTEPMPMYLYWHQRHHQDPMQRWLRSRVLEAVRSM